MFAPASSKVCSYFSLHMTTDLLFIFEQHYINISVHSLQGELTLSARRPGHHQVNSGHCLSGTLVQANAPAIHRQPAATVITQHHLYNTVTDLPAIIYRGTITPCTTGVLALGGSSRTEDSPHVFAALLFQLNLLVCTFLQWGL